MRKELFLLMSVFVATGAFAQVRFTPPPPGFGAGPFFTNSTIHSPEVTADHRVTFRLLAPEAHQVEVRGFTPEPIPMQKDSTGLWTATTEPLQPDLYSYTFVVDGFSTLDPSNTRLIPTYHSLGRSAFLVPGDNSWTPQPNEPRGAISHHVYHSELAGDERDFFVYAPPNYDPRRKRPYPVLYLLHGLGDEANAWIDAGAANVILDNLINEGKAEPMIAVMPLGYGNTDGPSGHRRLDMLPNFGKILADEIMHQVVSDYDASTNRDDHAVAGLSMGGAEAMLDGLNHMDKFAWFGSFSGAYNLWPLTRPAEDQETAGEPSFSPPGPGRTPAPPRRFQPLTLVENKIAPSFPDLDAQSNAQIKLLWIAVGSKDGLLGVNQQFKAYLDSKGVKATFTEVPGFGHEWPLWRRNLTAFAQLIFK